MYHFDKIKIYEKSTNMHAEKEINCLNRISIIQAIFIGKFLLLLPYFSTWFYHFESVEAKFPLPKLKN
jgi:hypothetical protein